MSRFEDLSTEQQDALVQLIAAAMKSGWWCAQERKQVMVDYHDAHPDCSGADMLGAALGDFPRQFVETRRDLVEAVFPS